MCVRVCVCVCVHAEQRKGANWNLSFCPYLLVLQLFEEELRGWAGEKEPVMTFVPVLECFPEIRRETQT